MYKLQNWSGLGGFVFQHWLLNPLIFTQSLDSLDTSALSGVFSSQDGPSEASTVSQHIQLMVYRIRESTSWYGKIYIYIYIYSNLLFFYNVLHENQLVTSPDFCTINWWILSGSPHSKIPNRGSSWHLGVHDHPSRHHLGRSRSRCCFELDKK